MAVTLNVGDVFLSINNELSGDNPHYHIVVLQTAYDEILVVHTTKEVEKVKSRCRKKEKIKFDHIDPTTCVVLNNKHSDTFSVDSAIDCNKAIYVLYLFYRQSYIKKCLH